MPTAASYLRPLFPIVRACGFDIFDECVFRSSCLEVFYLKKKEKERASTFWLKGRFSHFYSIYIFQDELEMTFLIIFTTEMMTKILAMGFILHKDSYMRNYWNIMDFVVVTSALAEK